MAKRTYPKLNVLELSKYIAELFLASEGSLEWIKEKKVLVIWHIIFLSTFGFLALQFLVHVFLSSFLIDNSKVTFFFRQAVLLFYCFMIIMFSILMFRYYKHLLLKSKDLRLQSIILFSLTFWILFASVYVGFYWLDPSFFNYSDPVLAPGPAYMQGNSLKKYLLAGDFSIYSACTAMNINYFRITSNSFLVSVVNVLQSVITIALIAIVISTFVQMASVKAPKEG